jgi:nucleotide-binding universal stress UspA family protein
MSVLVAVPDSPEGIVALAAAVAEADLLATDLIVVNLALKPLDTSTLPVGTQVKVIDRTGRADRDPVDAVLDEIRAHDVSRLVIGLKRRSPIGKALLGSISQRLLLESPVPVVAVKLRDEDDD